MFTQSMGKSELGSRPLLTNSNSAVIGDPQSFFKSTIGKGPYVKTGPAQTSSIHPPPFFSHHQAITKCPLPNDNSKKDEDPILRMYTFQNHLGQVRLKLLKTTITPC